MSYRGKIKILTGIELNLNFEDEQEENNIPFDKFDKLDFCLFEHVDGTEPYKPITKYCIRLKDINQIRQRVKCEAGLAHTDLLELSEIYSNGKELEYGMDCVISMMKEYNLFWEINTDKEHHYFDYIVNNWRASNIQKLFMKLKDNGVKIRSGSDTHNLRFYRIDRVRISNSMSAFEYFPEL